MKKVVSIGHEDFKRVIESNIYYVDKSLMIKELVDSGSMVTLFTRPRRFGKTLNLSMIRRFFEDERTYDGEKIDNGHLFNGLAIMDAGEVYTAMQQQYPVIKLSLKSAKQADFRMAYIMLKKEIIAEFRRHEYVLQGEALDSGEKQTFKAIMTGEGDDSLYYDAIRQLSVYLQKYHGKNVIVLIDEYDVPLENAYFRGFYNEMIDFVRSLFESALKTNDCLQFGVVTGCLRISRESIFTGLNNLDIYSVRNVEFGEYFGFAQPEIDEMLAYYGLEDKRTEVKEWYDGYRFGETEIYNPWSILKYVKSVLANPKAFPESYWANTSSNSIIHELIENADGETKAEMELLLSGETIEKPIHEDITYADIYTSADNLWNFLFFTGYLKSVGERQEGTQIYAQMTIPNLEVKSVYERHIISCFDRIKEKTREPLLTAVLAEDTAAMENELSELLQKSISYYDYAENYYHGFLTGLLTGMDGYTVVSNRESGAGRPDLILKTRRVREGVAVIFELKVSGAVREMERQCDLALAQIEEKNYAQALIEEGYDKILKYGVCFYKKECVVKLGK